MKLKDLVKKLASKPNQDAEVEFIVYEKAGNIVCIEAAGVSTTQIMRILAKREEGK